MNRVCLTGAESTGKSTLAVRLAQRLDGVVVAEYGRGYAERHGTDFTRAALRAIADGHLAVRVAAEASGPRLIVEDTDIVTTAAWSRMLFGSADPVLAAIPATADLYLMFDADTPWIDDGTRQFGTPDRRAAFDRLLRAELAERGIAAVDIGGDWDQRFDRAAAAVARLTA